MSTDPELKVAVKERHDPLAAIRLPDFRLFLSARVCMTLAFQILDLIIGWNVAHQTDSFLKTGTIGLVEAFPALTVALYAGHIADQRSRKSIITISQIMVLICVGILFGLTSSPDFIKGQYGLMSIYALVFVIGLARGFLAPALFGFQGQIVPRELYANASTWNSTLWHTAAVAGPALGGLAYGYAGLHYSVAIAGGFLLLSFIQLLLIPDRPLPVREAKETVTESLLSGLKFVFRNQVILGALSLDLFAVLFGGAVAMLPFFSTRLGLEADGLGILRSAPAAGAVISAILLVLVPIRRHAGRYMLYSVAGFGLCMIGFALSTNIWMAVTFLAISGMLDNVSVVVRSTALQLLTPDNMRGRVSSVNSIFIGSSNEIGAFESGVAAELMGLIPSVIFGGCMTIIVVLITAWSAIGLRKLDFRQMGQK